MSNLILLSSVFVYVFTRSILHFSFLIYTKRLVKKKRAIIKIKLPPIPPAPPSHADNCKNLCTQLQIAKHNTEHFQRLATDAQDKFNAAAGWASALLGLTLTIILAAAGIILAAATGTVITAGAATLPAIIVSVATAILSVWVLAAIGLILVATFIIVIIDGINASNANADLQVAQEKEDAISQQLITQCSDIGLDCLN